MGIGVDEKLMHAMKVEVGRLHGRRADARAINEITERLHETYPHRTLEQMKDRLKLVLHMGGLLIPEQATPRELYSNLLSPAAERLRPNPPLHANP